MEQSIASKETHEQEGEEKALELFKAQDYQAARRLFQELEEGARRSANEHLAQQMQHNLANCHAALNEPTKAIELLDRQPAGQNDAAASIYSRSLFLVHLNQLEAAVAELAKLEASQLDGSPALLGPVLELLSHCVNSSHLWKSQHQVSCVLVERLLRQLRAPIIAWLADERQWLKNLAHVLFLMDTRHEECAQLYQQLAQLETTADADPMVWANLCVSQILVGRNTEAEQLIEQLEQALNEDTNDQTVAIRLTQVNLAIGTLYCVKKNYNFGLARILEMTRRRADCAPELVWLQLKRCLLSLAERLYAQQVLLADQLADQLIVCLQQAEMGRWHREPAAVAREARHLRAILLRVIHD